MRSILNKLSNAFKCCMYWMKVQFDNFALFYREDTGAKIIDTVFTAIIVNARTNTEIIVFQSS